jgi:hypothetical protein
VKFISSLCIPLILATFTVVITLVQHNDNQLQRNEDKEIARIQREQDLNIYHVLADERRQLETDLADKTRQSNTNEIGTLLKETNGSLTVDPMIDAIIRTKILHILRQLNPIRAGQVFHCLIMLY